MSKRKADTMSEGGLLSPVPKRRQSPEVAIPLKRMRLDEQVKDEDSGSEYEDDESVADDADYKSIIEAPPTPISRPSSARPKPYHCTYANCNKSYARPKALAEHIRSHTNERPFSCTELNCTKTFRREDHLKRHIRSQHKNERPYACTWPDCNKSFSEPHKLKTHIAVHEGHEKFKCTGYDNCNEWFRKRETLRAHIAAVHEGKKPYECDYVDPVTGEKCQSGYASAYKLQTHKDREHKPEKPIKYWCQSCQTVDNQSDNALGLVGFKTHAELQEHMKVMHPPKCDECNRTFPTQKLLNQHAELAHSGPESLDARRKFLCDFPGCHGISSYGFTWRKNLYAHKRAVHEGLRPFVCGEYDLSSSKKTWVDGQPWDGQGACGKSCQTKFHLEEHVRTAHLGLEWTQVKRKRERREKLGLPADGRVRKTKEGDVSATSLLTGHGYNEEAGRGIKCVVKGCPSAFYREYDLVVHCRSRHNMEESEIHDAIREREALEGGNFWVGGLDDIPEEDYDDDDAFLNQDDGMAGMEFMDVHTGQVSRPTARPNAGYPELGYGLEEEDPYASEEELDGFEDFGGVVDPALQDGGRLQREIDEADRMIEDMRE